MTTPSPAAPGAKNWVLLNLLGLVWGTSFLSIGISLEGFSPLMVAAGRTSVAALALVVIVWLGGSSFRVFRDPRTFVFCALAGVIGYALPFALLAWGQQFVPSAVAGVAMGTVPLLLVPLVAIFSPEEGVGLNRLLGLGLGFVGIVLIVGPGATAGAGGWVWALGALACVGAAMSYAVASILTRRSPATPPLVFAAFSMICAAIVILPIALLSEGLPTEYPPRATAAILYLGLLPTALAGALRVGIIRSAGSLFMSMVSYIVPVWSVIFGATLMGESIHWTLLLALALILGGIAISRR